MDTPKYLYHYTSIDTLALILENKTLSFNSLLNVDDIDEAKTADIANFGKHMYVSCWTDTDAESIAMWNMYTPDMHGVRIRLPAYPFRKYHYSAGQYHFTEDIDTYLNMEKIYQDNKGMITSNYPLLRPVTYTRDEQLLFPKIRTCKQEEITRFLALKDLSDIKDNINAGYSFANVGIFKKEDWSFQREWRYLIFISPMGFQEANPPSLKTQQEFIRRMENVSLPVPYERFLIDLDEACLQQMEIVLGPRVTEAESILVRALLKEHGLEKKCHSSSLRIR